MTEITLLPKQQEAADFFVSSTQSMLIEARPGCGKTFMIEQLAQRVPNTPIASVAPGEEPKVVYLAFNVTSKDSLQAHLPGQEVRTFNSFGFKQLRKIEDARWKLTSSKQWKIVKAWALTYWANDRNYAWQMLGPINKVVSFLRDTATDERDHVAVLKMVYEYELTDVYEDHLFPVYAAIIQAGVAYAQSWDKVAEEMNVEDRQIQEHLNLIHEGFTRPVGYHRRPVESLPASERWIDFTDQIVLPIRWGLDIDQYDLIFEDEGQDQNAARLALLFAALKEGGKLVAVGDSYQAINGWCGADSQSLQKTIAHTDAVTLALNQSFRCPQSHTAYVRALVGYDIESVPWNEEGAIEDLPRAKLEDLMVRYYDQGQEMLVLSRVNAPLSGLAMSLLTRGIPVTVRGNDYGKGIVAVVRKICIGRGGKIKRGFHWDSFGQHLYDWHQKEVNKLQAKDAGEAALERLEDKFQSIWALYSGFDSEDPFQFISTITELFDDDRADLLVLSSIHRAKGQEADTVAILDPDKMPLYWTDTPSPEQVRQETNVIFVAYTRSKRRLILVR